MKTTNFFLALGAMLLLSATGCQMPKPMDEATIMAKADSAANAQMQLVADSMNENCETNKSAWVQAKADSIFEAETAAMAHN
jgi:hypothetical protein